MEFLYHGTHTLNGVNIARTGAILSPWYQKIERLERLFEKKPEAKKRFFEEIYPGKNISEMALIMASDGFGAHDIEHRVKSVSVSKDKSRTDHYGTRFDNSRGGGIVLALEITPEIKRILHDGWEKATIIFIPGKLQLESLRQVHLSPRCMKDSMGFVQKEFERYNPEYFIIS